MLYICIIDNGASRRRTQNARFRAMLAVFLFGSLFEVAITHYICIIDNGASRRRTQNARFRAMLAVFLFGSLFEVAITRTSSQ